MRRIEWAEVARKSLATLDKETARRIGQAIDRLAQSGAGDVKKLQGIDPPELRLRVGNHRIRFEQDDETIRILRVADRKDAYR